ncbi:hypothetical protein [Rathayibacter festucae]|uniref:hypothetical protein n=1 Tax=Rathayibacter festucae TaxID=110937 RepID=UPI0013E374E8|nr:hypothetical protein [Rathayibacter festucae]
METWGLDTRLRRYSTSMNGPPAPRHSAGDSLLIDRPHSGRTMPIGRPQGARSMLIE